MKRAIEDDEDDDGFDLTDERPLVRSRRGLPWLRMMLFSALCIAGLAYFAQHENPAIVAGPTGPVPATVLVAPPPTWTPLSSAHAVFALDKTLDKALGPSVSSVRQHSGGGREEILVVGALGEPRYARIALSQGIPPVERSFYVDMVRRAAEAGLSVERSTQTALLPSRFGPIETAAVTLAGPIEQSCQAFRFADAEAGFGFQGWLCGAEVQPVDRSQLACFIDAMTLAGPAEPRLKALFGRSEKGRADCPPPARTASAGGRPTSR